MDEKVHLQFISFVANRILAAGSADSKTPLLSLSFISTLPDWRQLVAISHSADLQELSNGQHYSLILSLFRTVPFCQSSSAEHFRVLLSALYSLGFRPKTPCEPENLTCASQADHINLCIASEFLVTEKALTCDHLLDDLRRVPRSFFVLRDIPNHMEDTIRLWLCKFPCTPELSEIGSDIQADVCKWIHVACALSRVYPSRIWKAEIQKNSDLTKTEIECNCELACRVLKELNAYVPQSWPLPDHIFRFFIAEIYWSTRPGARKFAKLDTVPVPVHDIIPPAPARLPRIDMPVKKLVATKPPRPSPRRAEPSLPAVVDPTTEFDRLLSIYGYMTTGHRKEKFVDTDDPSVLIGSIVKLLVRVESEHSFANLQRELASSSHSDVHMRNGIVFLTALSGSNNEFAASRTVVFFARRMVANGLPDSAPPRAEFRPFRKVTRKRVGLPLFASVATQTPSMLQSLVILRENGPKLVKGGRAGPAEYAAVACQTESIHGAATPRPPQTVSYPYGVSTFGLCPSIKKAASLPFGLHKSES
jgi:hypothetical protein